MKKHNDLVKIEKEIQSQWEVKKLYEKEVDHTKEKFFLTFPYPYMNGYLHLGHVYSMSKCEFFGRYQMMKGKNVLWPFGYHCTGQPIIAAAGRITEEIKEYGLPPKFPTERKKGGDMWQWDIMLKSGLKEGEIKDFVDPQYWIDFFPAKSPPHLRSMGFINDHRRSFITTDVNPYYDNFIRWQFNKLKSLNLLKFGKRMSVYSPKDKSICADHDRSVGEGKKAREYVVIKMKLLQPYPKFLVEKFGEERLNKDGLYLGAATLRPETMYGQTNCWLSPEGKYGVYEMKNKQLLFVSDVGARNMAHQFVFSEKEEDFGKYENVMGRFIKGKELFGCKVSAPLSIKYRDTGVYIWPMDTVAMKKTTGVVTSVPSDSPDDYMALKDMMNKKRREKYGIPEEQVKSVEVIPILETPKYGKNASEKICKELKIKNQNDSKKLTIAHDETYKEGFYNGIMTVGEFKGKPVKEVKDLIKDLMVKKGDAFLYSEPEERVVSRSGCECVCGLTDQWYILYGEEKWKKQLLEYVENEKKFNTFNVHSRKEFVKTIEWLREWGISREFGTGTHLPFDEDYLVESLSDSTIYMAYYTICHYLQGDIYGKTPGMLKQSADKFNDEFFEYVFCEGPMTEHIEKNFKKENMNKVREEFEYWYPVDIRCSAKDLIKNHLTFFLYVHCAIWKEEKYWPKSIFTNGYVNVDGKKMSKSAGNFLLLSDVTKSYPVDAIRIAVSDAGDTLDDANFANEVAKKSVLKLHNHLKWCNDMKKMIDEGGFRKKEEEVTPKLKFLDAVFERKMQWCLNETIKAYERMRFRDVLKFGWFELEKCKDRYDYYLGGEKNRRLMRVDLCEKFLYLITYLIAPIIPHTSEHIFQKLFKKGDTSVTIFDEKFPEKENISVEGLETLKFSKYFDHSLHCFRRQKERQFGKIKGGKLQVYVSRSYEDWQVLAFKIMKHFYKESLETTLFQRKIMKDISKYISENHKEHLRNKGRIIKFIAIKVQELKKLKNSSHRGAENDDWVIPFFSSEREIDEEEFWVRDYITEILKRELDVISVEMCFKENFEVTKKKNKHLEECLPMKPVIVILK